MTALRATTCPYETCRQVFGLVPEVLDALSREGGSCVCPICKRGITWGGGKSKAERELEEELTAERRARVKLERELRGERQDAIRAHAALNRLASERRTCPLCGKQTRLRRPERVAEWMTEHLTTGHNATANEIKLLTA